MPNPNLFHWAAKVSRRDIQRMYTLHARVLDMFEVREAQQFGRVNCRACGNLVPQPFWMGGLHKDTPLVCPRCGWQTSCGEFYESYTGKDLLPGSRTELFQDFLARFPAARTPQEKMLLLDWLIHVFHVHSGVAGRLVAMNVIQGSRDQLVELLSTLAALEGDPGTKEAFLAEEDNPIRRFRQKYGSRAKILEVAARLGIRGRNKMAENDLIAEILRLAPDLALP